MNASHGASPANVSFVDQSYASLLTPRKATNIGGCASEGPQVRPTSNVHPAGTATLA